MKSGFRFASMTVATALLVPLSPTTAVAAEPCVSGSEVRSDVAALVASLRDDVTSRSARAATAHALVDALHTFRGADADTPAERHGLGKEISALAKTIHDAGSKVERKAIVAQIKALTEQRERGAFTADERAELRSALAALKAAVVDRTDSRAEGRDVAAAFRALHEQFTCKA